MRCDHDRAMTNLEDTLRKELAERYNKWDEKNRESWQTRLKIEKDQVQMELNSRVNCFLYPFKFKKLTSHFSSETK